MKKIYYIVNLNSGKAVIRNKLSSVIDIFTKAGFETVVYSTQKVGEATEIARKACERQEFDYIVCSGGDGTFSEVINGVITAEHQLPVGFIPTGSTNDFARGIGIPLNVEEAAKSFVEGQGVKCDVGLLNNKTFLYVAAFGAFTQASYETSQTIKNVLGHAAYIFNGLSKLGKYLDCSCHMRVDYETPEGEEKTIESEFIYGMVTNSSSVAGFLSLDNFKYDDGCFEVTLIPTPKNLIQFSKIVKSLNNLQLGADKELFFYFRAKKATFTVLDGREIPWTRDGESGGKDTVHVVEDRHKAVTLIVKDPPTDKFVK